MRDGKTKYGEWKEERGGQGETEGLSDCRKGTGEEWERTERD